MSLTIVQQPNTLEPVYTNTIPMVINSSINNNDNFRYIYDVYLRDQNSFNPTFNNRIISFPRTNGQGLYSPHYVLRDTVSYKLNAMMATQSLSTTENTALYYFRLGEAWNPNFTASSTQNVGGFLQLTFPATHSFLSNDYITLDKIDNSVNTSYNTSGTVSSVTPLTLVTTIPFGLAVSSEIIIIDNVERLSLTTSNYYGFNSTRQYDERTLNFGNIYSMNATSPKPFLTETIQKDFKVFEWSTLSFFSDITLLNKVASVVYTSYDSNNNITATVSYPLTTTNLIRLDLATGLLNLYQFFSTSNFITFANSSYYTVQIFDLFNTPSSILYTYNNKYLNYIQRDYPVYQFAYLNKLGAFEYFTFQLISRTNRNIQRKEFRKVLAYNYSLGDRGRTIFEEQITEQMIFNTDWLTDDDAIRLRDMVESPEVYMLSVKDQDCKDDKITFDGATCVSNFVRITLSEQSIYQIGDVIYVVFNGGWNPSAFYTITNISGLNVTLNLPCNSLPADPTGFIVQNSYYNINRYENELIPMIVMDSNYQVKTTRTDDLFNFTITMEKAFPIQINI